VGLAIALQALAVGLIRGGFLVVIRLHYEGLDAIVPGLLIVSTVELGLIIGLMITIGRAARAGRSDVAVGWAVGLLTAVLVLLLWLL
jgi:hypothetical protein